MLWCHTLGNLDVYFSTLFPAKKAQRGCVLSPSPHPFIRCLYGLACSLFHVVLRYLLLSRCLWCQSLGIPAMPHKQEIAQKTFLLPNQANTEASVRHSQPE